MRRPRAVLVVPWAEALLIVGRDERHLTHRGGRKRPARTVYRWKRDGVPVQELGEFLVMWWRAWARDRLRTVPRRKRAAMG